MIKTLVTLSQKYKIKRCPSIDLSQKGWVYAWTHANDEDVRRGMTTGMCGRKVATCDHCTLIVSLVHPFIAAIGLYLPSLRAFSTDNREWRSTALSSIGPCSGKAYRVGCCIKILAGTSPRFPEKPHT